jgi:hypothetical protein
LGDIIELERADHSDWAGSTHDGESQCAFQVSCRKQWPAIKCGRVPSQQRITQPLAQLLHELAAAQQCVDGVVQCEKAALVTHSGENRFDR